MESGEFWQQSFSVKCRTYSYCLLSRSLLCITQAVDLPVLVQIVPNNCENLLLKVEWQSTKTFVAQGTNAAQRLMNTAHDVPKKNTRLQISAPLDFSHISHLGPGSGPFNSKIIDRKY
jgi:hypothetical protein